MSIPIKILPVLKGEASSDFNEKARAALEKKASVNFTVQRALAIKILVKARLR